MVTFDDMLKKIDERIEEMRGMKPSSDKASEPTAKSLQDRRHVPDGYVRVDDVIKCLLVMAEAVTQSVK